MLIFLFVMQLAVDIHINGLPVQCETAQAPVYNPDTRLLIIQGCVTTAFFKDGFEEK